MNKLAPILALTIIAILTTGTAYAQSAPTSEGIGYGDITTPLNLLAIAGAFVLAGIGWSLIGYQKKKRTDNTSISITKLIKTSIVGIVIGIISLVYLIYTDSSVSHLQVTTFHGFLNLIPWAFTIIVTTVVVLKKLFPDFMAKATGETTPKEP